MALQFAPIAGIALRYGAVALATYAATRAIAPGRLSQPVEDEMDATPEGISLRREEGQVNGTARWARVIRAGKSGPGLRFDATVLGRFKVDRT
jgi:N-acyl-D-aspartate/D-glutamate deacylase